MFIADFHIHSKYSRATSRECVPEFLDLWARRKGLGLIGTGDFTHPAWRQELRDKLVPAEEGLYVLKQEFAQPDAVLGQETATRFVVTGEISSIYKKDGRVRKVHNLIVLPDLEAAEALARRLEAIGNLHSDGRPILGLDSRDLLEITLEACPRAIFIPAHIWTPHFSLFGAYSGFDTIEECFGDLAGHIHALETGLSSNPPMNWRLSALDRFALVSNSDAHSPANLAREANLFDTELSYGHIARALESRDGKAFRGTLEFFPEEGKYHFDGHRNCKVCQSPTDTAAAHGLCPACGKPVTVGVLHRVEALADRAEGYAPPAPAHFESLVPLPEVIAASTGYSPKSIRGRDLYTRLLRELGPELHILRAAAPGDIGRVAGPAAAEGVRRLRAGEVTVHPGYDGEYGKVRILGPEEIEALSGQTQLFAVGAKKGGRPATGAKEKRAARVARPAQAESAAAHTDALHGLNAEQRAAAFSTSPVTAVIAGPGTGKTKTLVARIAHLVQERGVSPAQVTAVTFTNRAAAEMRERLERHFGGKRAIRGMTVATFHTICLEQLKKARGTIAVADDATARSVLREVARERGVDGPVRDLLRRISLAKCGAAGDVALPDGLYDAYCARLREYGALDYDDLLVEALGLAGTGARRGKSPFAHLLVDEFQDTNPVQYELVRRWARDSESLFVIGDPDQAIYGFRGSDARCFDRLRADYPDMEPVALARNYRSAPEILRTAAPVIAGASAGAALRAERPGGERVRLVRAGSAFSEALFVAKEIGRMVGGIDMLDSGAAPALVRGFSDIAVLYRTNRQAAVLEECLAGEGIPYVVAGRDDALSLPKAERLLAFFRLLLNPADLLALRACLRELAACPPGQVQVLLGRYRESAPSLEALRALFGELPRAQGAPLSLSALLEQYGPTAHTARPHKLVASWIDGEDGRGEEWAEKLLQTAPFYRSMGELLFDLTLGGDGDLRRFGGKRYTGDAVHLATLHGAKGLEFPAVFVCGVADGMIPHKGHGGHPADPGEERRLLYVGMTRAQDELLLLHAGPPSPFLADIPAALLDVREAHRRREAPQGKQLSLFGKDGE